MPTGKEIMTRASTLLNDASNTRWPLPEIADWINEGQRAIVLAQPSASSMTMQLDLAVGTLQSLPTAVSPLPLSLLSLTRNLQTQDNPRASARAITIAERADLDAQEPQWHDATYTRPKTEVRHLIFDENNPREYYVYPPNDGSGAVEAVVSILPTLLAIPEDSDTPGPTDLAAYDILIALPEPYSVPLLDYVLSRCYGKDDLEGDVIKAQAYFAQFAAAVGLKIQTQTSSSPNRKRS